jgi:hypothetical protein
VEGKKTTYDVLLEKYDVHDGVAIRVGKIIHDFEIDAKEDASRVTLRETLGLCYVLKGLDPTSKSDSEIVDKAMIVFDALYATLKDES